MRAGLPKCSGRKTVPLWRTWQRGPVVITAAEAIGNAHDWFEVNSGWAPPDEDELAEWLADGVCRCPDDCLVEPEGWCRHGLASWLLILRALDTGR